MCSAEEKLDKWPCWKESKDVCLRERLQRSTREEEEGFRVPGLSCSNWVSDLLPLSCFIAIRPCVGSVLRMCVCVCVCYINSTVFSFQNEERISCSVWGRMQREGAVDETEAEIFKTLWPSGQLKKWKDFYRFVRLHLDARVRENGGVSHTDWPHPAFQESKKKKPRLKFETVLQMIKWISQMQFCTLSRLFLIYLDLFWHCFRNEGCSPWSNHMFIGRNIRTQDPELHE